MVVKGWYVACEGVGRPTNETSNEKSNTEELEP
jgi:hypothetical protein